MPEWPENAFFYHIYPLGFCDAPQHNDFISQPQPRLELIQTWLGHIRSLGANAIYLGPVFESGTHGYDTADYYHVDRRLGTAGDLASLSAAVHTRGMRLILDGVFNHTGRDFWAFRDVLANGQNSPYCSWFQNLRFDRRSPYNDPFSYDGWNGHYNLVKLNLSNPQVKSHIFGAVEAWMREFNIDGLRLDAADCLDPSFISDLSAFCRRLKPDFWLVGEVIHGDYNRWANQAAFDSVTNYEAYKGLYSSLNDSNYFEIAYALNRQFGPSGIYRGLRLYNFADNHDVDRVASSLRDSRHLFPLYALLFSMPGIPSVYYGSEWGITGKKHNGSDAPLRPALQLEGMDQAAPMPALVDHIRQLAQARALSPALQSGDYRQMQVTSTRLVFSREAVGERVIVGLNSASEHAEVNVEVGPGQSLRDMLDGQRISPSGSGVCSLELPPYAARLLRVEHY